MNRRWQPPKPTSPQIALALEKRPSFVPASRETSDTSAAAAEGIGMRRSGDALFNAGDLASAMVGMLERKATQTRLGRVMFALDVRAKVYQYLVEHPEGATADEIAHALGYKEFTVRPRVCELKKQKRIVDSGVRRPNSSGRSAKVWVLPVLSEVEQTTCASKLTLR